MKNIIEFCKNDILCLKGDRFSKIVRLKSFCNPCLDKVRSEPAKYGYYLAYKDNKMCMFSNIDPENDFIVIWEKKDTEK